jgi:cyanophycin synthetase
MNKDKKICHDCELPKSSHYHNWIEQFLNNIVVPNKFHGVTRKLERHLDKVLEKLFSFFKLVKLTEDFDENEIQLRSRFFINEAKKHGATFKILKGPAGTTNHFVMQYQNKKVRFDNLPIAQFANSNLAMKLDDKYFCKKELQKNKFPVAEGEVFWFNKKKESLKYGAQLGFPVVVKPRSGSVSRHVTTGINNEDELKTAVEYAIEYSPSFIIEKDLSECSVHRITIIDHDFIACAKQVPAHVIGDGVNSVKQLIEKKSLDENRNRDFYYPLKVTDQTFELLEKQNRTIDSVPHPRELIYLQTDPFMKLGGDIAEVTEELHPKTRKMLLDVAKLFDIKVVGIDFMIKDISKDWEQEKCGILELNTVPCIEIHHLPTYGSPQNVAEALFKMTKKYYL